MFGYPTGPAIELADAENEACFMHVAASQPAHSRSATARGCGLAIFLFVPESL